ncbi:hypothetical protein SCMU_28900 [Sinomonas cyclohexanicum]|uniref:2-nitropropane dioxygenase n=1 Tax=Sinomonas cyclohexanicum TaxID=322009 RepID=A0ABM7PXL9_SINCY|nr:nucleotidyltransferase family protein [Corynebacterium cyclohexanicum]BCT77048.1 hypothetical protein SCMU_28900 [Corynebacterium cyclohexanicum]
MSTATGKSEANGLPLVDLPLEDRVRLAHALIESAATGAGADLLHIKGYSTFPGLYAPGRESTDVDVIVRPAHVDALVEALRARGWRTVTTFRTGSVFHHAMTLWNDQWGYVDVHRAFPGVGIPADDFFERLWEHRATMDIAGWPCLVPTREHQALMIALHAARDPHRGADDVAYLRSALSPAEWDRVEALAGAVGAHLSFAAATGHLDEWAAHPEHDVWEVMSRGGTRVELFRARWRAAQGTAERAGLLKSLVVVNRDHLRMRLQREPRLADVVREVQMRAADVLRAATGRRAGEAQSAHDGG